MEEQLLYTNCFCKWKVEFGKGLSGSNKTKWTVDGNNLSSENRGNEQEYIFGNGFCNKQQSKL